MAWELRQNMMRVAVGILRNGIEAEDAVSDAIFKAYQQSEQLREKRHFKTWLTKIVVRCCYDVMRRHRNEILTDDFTAYDEPVLENEDGSVLELVKELPLHYREALILHYYEGYKAHEIAHVLSVPTVTILVRLSRGRKKLRTLLEKEDICYGKQTVRQNSVSQDKDGEYCH
jgi:RNA polymerase sigma-70 factor (ECF subfamily)